MRIFILTLGTRGDFEPFWALGRLMRQRGHQVTIGTSAFHFQDDPSLNWVPVGAGTKSELLGLLRSLTDLDDRGQRAHAYGQKWVIPQIASAKAQISAVASKNDYFINNLKFSLMQGKAVFPGAFVSYDPPPSLAAARAWGSYSHGGRTLELVAMNRALIDPEAQWDAYFNFTGFWHQTGGRSPASAQLKSFLDQGGPPAVMTMGSMVTFDPGRLAQCFLQALQISGLRGIVVGGWSEQRGGLDRTGRMMVLPEVDYDWLFSRAACVLHHGGVGTVNSVLRAGVPSILLPQIPSQELWGKILMRENLCVGTFDTHSLDPKHLAGALRLAMNDVAVKSNALKWKTRLDSDPGISEAARLIEAHWEKVKPRSPAP